MHAGAGGAGAADADAAPSAAVGDPNALAMPLRLVEIIKC